MMEFKKHDLVRSERLGPGLFEVLAVQDRELTVKLANGKSYQIFKAHCSHQTPILVMQRRKKIAQQAQDDLQKRRDRCRPRSKK